jgi:transposase InsO family protein
MRSTTASPANRALEASQRQVNRSDVSSLDVPSRPWLWSTVDFVVGLPPVLYHGALVDQILTVTDPLSKMVVLVPLPSTATAEDVAGAYYDTIYRRFGAQASIVSDRDPKFSSDFWRALHRRIGRKLRMSSSHHPQTDGRSEVTNKTLGQVLRILCS